MYTKESALLQKKQDKYYTFAQIQTSCKRVIRIILSLSRLFQKVNLMTSIFCHLCKVWQYGLWSFQTGGTKLESFLPKNHHTPRKLLNFENWISGGLRVVQNPTFLSNSKIDGSHKIFSLSMSKALEKNVFFENWCMFKIGSRALKFQKISRTRNVDFWLFEPP